MPKRDFGGVPKRRRPVSGSFPGLIDPRTLEGLMREAFVEGASPDSGPRMAQELIYGAFDELSRARQIELARGALALWPDCADAYVLLAENADTADEMLSFYESGVAAGERALGAEVFQHDVGRFWLDLDTRPYMRARLGLSQALWVTGRGEEALVHARELLRLNPNDNQGVRYNLADWLLALGRDEQLAELLHRYPRDGSASWAYHRLALAFRSHGDSPQTRHLLKRSRATNKHVPAYLLGAKALPAEPPRLAGIGDINEAIVCTMGGPSRWLASDGALNWLQDVVSAKGRSDTLA